MKQSYITIMIVLVVFGISVFGCGKKDRQRDRTNNACATRTTDQSVSATMLPRKPYRLSDFSLDENLTGEAVVKQMGEPDRYWGSGLIWFVYTLDTGEELWLWFGGPGDRLMCARVVRMQNGEFVEERTVFDVLPEKPDVNEGSHPL